MKFSNLWLSPQLLLSALLQTIQARVCMSNFNNPGAQILDAGAQNFGVLLLMWLGAQVQERSEETQHTFEKQRVDEEKRNCKKDTFEMRKITKNIHL